MRSTITIIALSVAALACATDATAPPVDRPAFAKGGPADPTATWLLPLDTSGLAFRSDGQSGSSGYSVYANGACGVVAKIFATTAASNSGDATITLDPPKGRTGCGRTITLRYPDGGTESVRTFANLRQLQSTTSRIEIGQTVLRTFAINPGVLANNPSRCGRLVYGPNGSVAVGSDSVQVTRLDARTWQVETRPGLGTAWCESLDQLYDMPVSFVIVASYDLP